MEASSVAEDTMSYYYVSQFLASGILGLVFFVLGLGLAALLWSGARKRAHRLQEENRELRSECQDLERMRGTA